MRLLTHNMLQCHVKGCNKDNFPLALQNIEIEKLEAEFTPEFVERLLSRIDFPALQSTCISLGIQLENEENLELLHDVLLKTKIKEGEMVCRGCGHVYPIKDGIPNMLLNDDEV
ncbi:hypothetical protein HDV04_003912 [Boothiomyces sp. JEL0838]|nr:hypothetical protein HDV04_003912 [Boothiomyces sp. JEL0838]